MKFYSNIPPVETVLDWRGAPAYIQEKALHYLDYYGSGDDSDTLELDYKLQRLGFRTDYTRPDIYGRAYIMVYSPTK